MNEAIELLRTIRDRSWQMGRCHESFSEIETNAVKALKCLGVDDGVGPNPRTKEWWKKSV